MKWLCSNACNTQFGGHNFTAVLGRYKNQYLFQIFFFDQVFQELCAFAHIGVDGTLQYFGRLERFAFNVNFKGI